MERNEQLKKGIRSVYATIVQTLVDSNYRFPGGGKMDSILDSFLHKFEEYYGTCSPERLVDYCVYQVYKNRNIDDQAVLTKNAFGPTAFKKFDQRNVRGVTYYENQWLGNITRESLVKRFPVDQHRQHPLHKFIYMEAEENTKLRCLNTPVGLVICDSSTLMWSPFSPACQQCSNDEKCKVITKKKYPELYRIRIEEYGKKNH